MKNWKKCLYLSMFLVISTLLVSCGGSGGGDNSAPVSQESEIISTVEQGSNQDAGMSADAVTGTTVPSAPGTNSSGSVTPDTNVPTTVPSAPGTNSSGSVTPDTNIPTTVPSAPGTNSSGSVTPDTNIPTVLPANFSLRIDPNFSRVQLPADVRIWYDRMWAGLDNPSQIYNLTDLANSNDTYNYGRTLGDHITALLHVLRLTGDAAILDEIDRLTQLMRAQLKDWSITTFNGTTYEADGYLNWLYFYDAGYHGTDIHVMDEMFTHQMMAAVTYAFYVNSDVDSRYAERYNFWINYLKNHFEAKWRKRNNVPTGNFMEKDLAHIYTAWIRYHYYMYKMTGEKQYLTEATRRALVVKDHMVEVGGGSAYVWDHRMTEVNNGSSWGCQPFYYARGTVQYMIDLSMEGFSVFDDTFMTKLAGTVSQNIINNGSSDFAPDVCGGVAMGGLSASGYARETQKRWSGTSGYVEIGAWDKTGEIESVTGQVYNSIENDVTQPRYILNAAGMVFSMLY